MRSGGTVLQQGAVARTVSGGDKNVNGDQTLVVTVVGYHPFGRENARIPEPSFLYLTRARGWRGACDSDFTLPNQRLYRATALLSLLASACGGSSSAGPGTTPTGPNNDNSLRWSIAGNVVDTGAHQTVSGATVTPAWNLAAVSSSNDGSYLLGSSGAPPPNPSKLTISADGFVTHEQWVSVQAAQRTDVTLDLIRNSAPFSMDFYRQLARGTYDQDGPYTLLRWSQVPKFYLKTTDQLNRSIASEVIATIRDAVVRAVPLWTGGQYSADLESGPDVRASTPGWINILITTDPGERVTCGQSYVGRDPGEINLIINPVCSCGSIKIPGHVVVHEVGHALGFFHVSDQKSVMYPRAPGNCPVGELSADERYHAAIAYQRARGNAEPDNDPSAGLSLRGGGTNGPTILVKN